MRSPDPAPPVRIAQLANFVGPTSGGMKTVLERIGRGYVEAGAARLLRGARPTMLALHTALHAELAAGA